MKAERVVLLVLLAAAPGAALGQTRAAALREPQLGPAERAVTAPQIAAPSRAGDMLPAPQLATGTPGAATAQISAAGAPPAPAQLSTGEPTAASPPPLSRPAQGRNVHTARVAGSDACDPARLRSASAAAKAACARTLERRAHEMPSRPAPPPPRRDRVAAQPSATESARSADLAAQALAHGTLGQSQAAQAIAGRTLQPPSPPTAPSNTQPVISQDAATVLQGIESGAPTAVPH
jgi:hypothetical protein